MSARVCTPGASLSATPTRRGVVAGLAYGAAALLPNAGFSQAAYPNRPVRMVVPFAAGGGADIISRLLQPHLQQALGQPFVVENRAGAAGRIGAALVAKAEADGHTLLTTTEASLVIAPHTGAVLGYDPLKDFAPISLLTRNTVILVVHPSVPARTLAEFMALARAQPGKIFFASSGVGGPNHLAGEIFNRMTGLDIVHVPFVGTGAALPAVLGNQVSAMWGFTAGLIPFIRDGSLRALAVGSRERLPVLPDVPTVAEAGVPGYEAASWIGMLAPAATPQPVVDQLWNAVSAAMQLAAVRDPLVNTGSEVVVSTPVEFARVIESDFAKYGRLADIFRSTK
jgi:tripartite-type tricarboxylate transporter receptor subunit TctC